MALPAPSVVGIRSTQTFAKEIVGGTFSIRDVAYAVITLTANQLNAPTAISIFLQHATTPHDKDLDIDLRIGANATSRRFFVENSAFVASTLNEVVVLAPNGGPSSGAGSEIHFRHVPGLLYYPAETNLYVAIRTRGGTSAPTVGILTYTITGYY